MIHLLSVRGPLASGQNLACGHFIELLDLLDYELIRWCWWCCAVLGACKVSSEWTVDNTASVEVVCSSFSGARHEYHHSAHC